MFPIHFNFPFIKQDGSRTTIGDAMGGGSQYVLPPATSETLGGVKIGSGIEVAEDGTISVNAVASSPFSSSAQEVTT